MPIINYVNLHKRLNTSKFLNKLFHTGICLLIYLIVQTVLENTYLGIQISLDSVAIQRIPLRISDNNLIVKKNYQKNLVPTLLLCQNFSFVHQIISLSANWFCKY